MTDREALFRAILANPDDDTLRLIYADALEEDGEGRRAAFVRAQVELAPLPEYDPQWIRAKYHDREQIYGLQWLADLPRLPNGLRWSREPFHRGFPLRMLADEASIFVANAERLFSFAPIDSLELPLVKISESLPFARCPWLDRLTRLSIVQGLSGQAALRVLNSRHYIRLRALHIGPGLTTQAAARTVVRSVLFQQLTELSCRDDRQEGFGIVAELARLADPPRLKTLDVSGNRITPEQVGRLIASPAMSAVENLDLSENNNLGAEGIGTISAANLPRLRSLHLMHTRPQEEGIRALMRSPFLAELRSLSLGGNHLPPTAAHTLIDSPAVENLRVLDLRENRLGDRGVAALADNPALRNLALLNLAANMIEDAGAIALAESPHLAGLIHLNVSGNIISPAVVTRLKRRFGDRVLAESR
jgi:uncharacterized protein (TIGR02996 family)